MRRGADHGRRVGQRRACVRRFQGDGCSVAVLDPMRRRSRRVRRIRRYVRRGDPESLAAAVDEAAAALGGLDVVVAAAGIAARGTVADTVRPMGSRARREPARRLPDGPRRDPHLRAAGGGAIVNIASQLGLVAAASAAAYCASRERSSRSHAQWRSTTAPRASASTASARGRPTRRCSSRTSARRQIRRRSARPTRRCTCTRASSQPKSRRRRGLPGRARLELDDGRGARRRWGVHRPMIVIRSETPPRSSCRSIIRSSRHARTLWPGPRAARDRDHGGRVHDIGWRSWEACSSARRRDGRPQNFLGVDIGLHLEFYEAGIARSRRAIPTPGCSSEAPRRIYRQRYGTQAALTLKRAADAQAMVDDSSARSRSASPCSASSASRTTSSGETTCCCRSSIGSRCGSARAIPRNGHDEICCPTTAS